MINLKKLNMKQTILLILFCITLVESNRNNYTFYPRLPVGEYQVNIKSILPCDPQQRNKIKINLRLNKVSPSKAEFEGNWTVGVPFDDTLTFHLDFDQKSSNGGWANNAISFKRNKACSTLKSFFKKKYWKNFWFPDSFACPVSPGIYILKDLPSNNMENVLENLPKILIYGTYRLRYKMTKNNEEIGCFHMVSEIKRPWEMP